MLELFSEYIGPKKLPTSFCGLFEVYDTIGMSVLWDHNIVSYSDHSTRPSWHRTEHVGRFLRGSKCLGQASVVFRSSLG